MLHFTCNFFFIPQIILSNRYKNRVNGKTINKLCAFESISQSLIYKKLKERTKACIYGMDYYAKFLYLKIICQFYFVFFGLYKKKLQELALHITTWEPE